MLGTDAEEAILPLSNDTIRRRINEISSDIENNLFKKLKRVEFTLQIDESKDVSNKEQLLVFIRFIGGDDVISQFFVA